MPQALLSVSVQLGSFDGSSDSLENCSGRDSNQHQQAAIASSTRVPFKWEEAPGKPIAADLPSCHPDHQTSLQLPPKLQCQGHQTPLFLQQIPSPRPSWLHPSSPARPDAHPALKRLYKYLLKTASWSQQPLHSPTPLSQSCLVHDARHDELTLNDRFFFDKATPKEIKYSVSMDSWKARLPLHEIYKRPYAFVRSKALSFSPPEEHPAETTASSPLQPILFHERDGSASPWQPISIKALDKLGGDDNDEGFHDLFSTASSSLEKPSQRTDESMESSCPSSPWFLDFGPKEHEIHEEKGGSKLVVRLVAIIKLKNIISSKMGKLRKRREEANQQSNNTSMWSPTLATYLFNQQKEERESRRASLHDHLASEIDDDDEEEEEEEEELPSSSSATSSHRFQINPDYHLPGSILRGHLHTNDDFSESGGSSSFRVNQLRLEGSPCFSEEEEDDDDDEQEEEEKPHKLSLREQLDESDDEYPLQFMPPDQSTSPQILDSQRRQPKGLCRVRKTVKVLAATIKLILVQTEFGKRKVQRPSLTYGSCLKPTLRTISPLPSTHK